MKKKLISLFLIGFTANQLYAQNNRFTPNESQPYNPGTLNYQQYGYNNTAGCSIFSFSVTNGTIINNSQLTYGNIVAVVWNEVESTDGTSLPQGQIDVTMNSCSNTAYNGYKDKLEKIVILSLKGIIAPDINVSGSLNYCSTQPITLSVPAYQYPGTNNYPATPAPVYSSYEWSLPAGWLGPQGQSGTFITASNSIQVTPNACGNGVVTLRLVNTFADPYSYSYPKTITLNRTALAMNASGSTTINCGNTTPITFSVPSFSCTSSYNWSIPTGWQGSSTTNSITVTPNGLNGGTVSVSIPTSCGTLQTSKTVSIIVPSNNASIPENAINCSSSASYSVANIPSGLSIKSWAISPSTIATIPTNTTSNPVAVTKVSNGSATLTAIIGNQCGTSYTLSKAISFTSIPAKPTSISFSRLGSTCYYKTTCPAVAYATSYVWNCAGYGPETTLNPLWNAALEPGTRTVTVKATNSCGESLTLSQTKTLTAISGSCMARLSSEDDIAIVKEDSTKINIYPNPSELDYIKISGNGDVSTNCTVLDIDGTTVFSTVLKPNQGNIDLTSLKSGIYFIHLESTNYKKVFRFVKI